jgi:hypothetical protein
VQAEVLARRGRELTEEICALEDQARGLRAKLQLEREANAGVNGQVLAFFRAMNG